MNVTLYPSRLDVNVTSPRLRLWRDATLEYWVAGGLFTLVYLAAERATFVYQLDGLGITLWSPSAGISLVFLLAMGLRFAPFIFIASLLTDFLIYTGPRGFLAPVGTSLILALGFAGLAIALAKTWRIRKISLARVVAMLAIVPAGILVMALVYCTVLYACGILFGERFLIAVRNLWIGDTLGIVTLLPAAVTVSQGLRLSRAPTRAESFHWLAFVLLLAAALWIIFGLKRAHEYQFFYMLFIPVMWIAVRAGYAGVSIALPIVDALIMAMATTFNYAVYDFTAFQLLMLVLCATGLLLGAAVTEARSSAEQMLAQEADLARATRHALIGATGTAVAHEIRQPLAATTNYLHAAHRILVAPGDDRRNEAVDALAKAQVEARRVRETLERVRNYVSSGRLELTDVNMEQTTEKIVALIGRDARERRVRIETSVKAPLPTVRGDAIQLEQLLLNLICNAVDAAGADQSRPGLVAVRVFLRGDRVVAMVEDNGAGVPAKIADRLFEPFETTKKDGMGLGLTLVRQIADAHAGTLTWQNVPYGGARFTIELRIDGP